MKSNIDLTEHKDFDPDNFKIKKVISTYSDKNGNKSRLPWDKDGKILTDHTWGYLTYMGNYISANTMNIWYSTEPNIWYDEIDNTLNITGYMNNYTSTTSNMNSITYRYGMHNSITWSVGDDPDTYSIIHLKENTFNHGFRLGKVKDMKLIETKPRRQSSKYKNLTYNIMNEIKDGIKYPSYRLRDIMKYKSVTDIFKDTYQRFRHVYNGYVSYIDECNVRNYKELPYYSRAHGDYPLSEILDAHRRHIKYICRPKVNTNKESFLDDDNEPRKVNWPDYHSDYLREIQGLEPRHDWRHGKDFEANSTMARRLLAEARENLTWSAV